MHQFRNDYSDGAAPEVISALIRTNGEQTPAYGDDAHCAHAAELIRAEIGQPNAIVRFVPGGTAANILAISGLTEEFEGAICARDAHPTIHETGAIEATGRRLLATDDPFGILTPRGADVTFREMTATGCHTTRPGMIYFSDTTEFGHVCSASAFDALCDWAHDRDLAVYVDGARLASAMTAAGADLSIRHLATRADAFTLGGTKNGLLFGEALVLRTDTARGSRLADRLPYLMKRAGAMLAKGRLMGVQFEAAFGSAGQEGDSTVDRSESSQAEDDPRDSRAPYWRWAAHANALAIQLARELEARGYERCLRVSGNQQFFWVAPTTAKRLEEELGCETMIANDPTDAGRVAVRFVTSWATTAADVAEAVAFAACERCR